MPREQRDRIAEQFPPAPAVDERSLAGRLARLKRQANGREPFVFDEVMELAYRPGPGLSFIDNTFVEHDGRLWNFHITGSPEDLEKADPRIRQARLRVHGLRGRQRAVRPGVPRPDPEHAAGRVGLRRHRRAGEHPPARGGFACVTTGVGMQGTRCGVALSTDLLDWRYHERNPVLPPRRGPSRTAPARTATSCASATPTTSTTSSPRSWATRRSPWRPPPTGTGSSWRRSRCSCSRPACAAPALRVAVRAGARRRLPPVLLQRPRHLAHDQRPARPVPGHQRHLPGRSVRRRRGLPLRRPLVAVEHRKEDLRRKDRLRGISHHGDVDDERRNLAGMYVAELTWDGDFPMLSRPDPMDDGSATG